MRVVNPRLWMSVLLGEGIYLVVFRERRRRLLKMCVDTVLKRKDKRLFAYRFSGWIVIAGRGGEEGGNSSNEGDDGRLCPSF